MKKLLLGTKNKGKILELTSFLSDLPLEILSLTDVGITDDVEETGNTYKENAILKAKTYASLSGLPTLADDGGLEIAALNNAPGIRSRRWLGYEATDEELVAYMKKVALELPDANRNARFVVVLALVLSDGTVHTVEEHVEGVIAKTPLLKLLVGYPYRSFFYLPKLKKYYHESELTESEMKEYNHRYKAVERIKKYVRY